MDEGRFLNLLSELETEGDYYQKLIQERIMAADTALKEHNPEAFILISEEFSDEKYRKVLPLSADLMRIKIIAEAMKEEEEAHMPMFTEDVDNWQEFKDKYIQMNLFLRRLELDFFQENDEEAFSYIEDRKISPYTVATLVYNLMSIIGHREELMMKIASWYLNKGKVQEAYLYLEMIQQPSEDACELCNELRKVLYYA